MAPPRRGKRSLKLLALSDAGGALLRVNQLCERVVSSTDCDVDAVLISGGLVAPREAHEYEALEAVGCAEGDMTALVSRVEMITCRVVYIPDDNDPPTTRSLALPPPTLTQYSINVYNRAEKIAPGIAAMGESHYFKLVNDGKDPLEDAEFVLVLRDSSARSQLPARPLAGSEYLDDSRIVEIVGGCNQDPRVEGSRIFVGSLQLGQYAILELEKEPADDAWGLRGATFRQLPPLDVTM